MDKVLIVDDDRFTQNLINKFLYQKFETRTADDGPSCLRLMERFKPDAVILDVEMPGQNGYEVCDAIKRNEDTASIPVLFLSSRTSVRERVLGFEVGGDDFLVKPCKQEILIAKLEKLLSYYHQTTALKASVSSAQKTAVEAMSMSSELGRAIRFVESSFAIDDFDALGKGLIGFMVGLELRGCVLLKGQSEDYFFSTNKLGVSPLEKDVLSSLHDSNQRIIEFGFRTQVNYPNVALLVINMPVEDRERYGRIKDNIPFVLGSADAKINVLNAEVALKQQSEKLSDCMQNMRSVIPVVSKAFTVGQTVVSNAMAELNTDLGMHLHKLSLEHDQEEYIFSKVQETSALLSKVMSNGELVEHQLSEIITQLDALNHEQSKIIQDNLSAKKDNDSFTQDIELF